MYRIQGDVSKMERKLFLVVWRDACGGSSTGWRDMAEVCNQKIATVWSCGLIVHEDDDRLVICPHMIVENGEAVEGDAELAIPKDWVVSKRELFIDEQ